MHACMKPKQNFACMHQAYVHESETLRDKLVILYVHVCKNNPLHACMDETLIIINLLIYVLHVPQPHVHG